MLGKRQMKDMLVVLPGITGSVLTRNGQTLWGPVPGAFVTYLKSLGGSLSALKLPDDPEIDDGIRATQLVPYTIAPGLERFDGYNGFRRLLMSRFELTTGKATDDSATPANYFEFPYDWRRSNRQSAAQLRTFIDRELPRWREQSDNPDARVIFICHSMGGLVARYYIEVLEGFAYTKALITFGTPHRGSVNAIDYIANGYRKLGMELENFTAIMRSLPSMYELLPRYAAVRDTDGDWRRTFETQTNIRHLDRSRALAAYRLYTEIDEAYDHNHRLPEYAVELLPVFGWGHDTYQSASVSSDGRLTPGFDHPPTVDLEFANGDGTVPRVSAIPIELNDKPLRWSAVNQRHATIQNTETLISNLAQNLGSMQGDLRAPARGTGIADAGRALHFSIDEAFIAGEPIVATVRVESGTDPGGVTLHVSGEVARTIEMKPSSNHWIATVEGLLPGVYHAHVTTANALAGPEAPVADIFEVL